jgi:diadenosine tetraphosphate (Ap4A) HIT family hydrolase
MPWWPEQEWARMQSGAGCPMCADAHLPTNEHGDLIAELPGSYARLSRNQSRSGYTVVIAKRHAVELHDLSADELRVFWTDVAAVGRAISVLFSPVKLDNLVMGHLCPHVHCHVYPQYATDDPRALVNVQAGSVRLDDVEWKARLASMREHLMTHQE